MTSIPTPDADVLTPAGPATAVGRWLAVLAGMRPSLVDRYAGDRHQFIALAFILFATTVEAAVSGGFAVSQAFRNDAGVSTVPWWGVVLFAMVWGLIIFTIDRYMVLGLDGIHGYRALIMIAFRGALALVLGVVMSTPLVIALFSSDLHNEVIKIQGDQLNAIVAQQDTAQEKVREAGQKQKAAWNAYNAAKSEQHPDPLNNPDYTKALVQANASETACENARQQAALEYDDGATSGHAGVGPAYTALEETANSKCNVAAADEAAAQQAYANATKANPNIDKEITASYEEWQAAEQVATDAKKTADQFSDQVAKAESQKSIGLLTQLTALNALTRGNSEARWGHWGIIALLVGLELMPVLFKGVKQSLHGWRGDEYLSLYEQACKVEDEATFKQLRQWHEDATKAWQKESSLQTSTAKDMALKQKGLQQEMNDEIVLTQRVLMRRALREWREVQARQWGQSADDLETEMEAMRVVDDEARRARAEAGPTPPEPSHDSGLVPPAAPEARRGGPVSPQPVEDDVA
jgi:hypothetical protein